MSFLKSSCSFSRFKVLDEVPETFWGDFVEKLREFAFKDIDELPEDRAWGWVCFEDMLDTNWYVYPPQKGGEYLTFSLRLDTRRLPPAVVKKHLNLALKKEEAAVREQGKTYVARERKKEIREQVILVLKRRFLPIPAEFQIIWNTAASAIYFASTQQKMLDLFQEYFTHSFGLHLEPLTPYGLAAAMLDDNALERLDLLEPSRFDRN